VLFRLKNDQRQSEQALGWLVDWTL
jgi:hypothetical protein